MISHDLLYYIVCVLMAVAILSTIGMIYYVKKVIKKQNYVIDKLIEVTYKESVICDRLFSIANDVYDIRQRSIGK